MMATTLPEPAASGAQLPEAEGRLKVVKARHPGRLVGTILAAIILFVILNSILFNPRWGWDVFAQWFFAEPVLVGLGRTLLLTAFGSVLGFAFGTLLALARVSGSPLLSGLAWGYVWVFRSIPLIVLLLILNNLGYLYETVSLGVPFTQVSFFSYDTAQLLTPFTAAVVGLALNQTAFCAEIIRGGILSVDQHQFEAAAALGLPRNRQTTRIVLPQAIRSILPSGFNELIALTKGTSMVYVLALPELFYTVQIIYRRNLEVIPLLMVATVWYLVILTVLSIIQHHVEKRFARGALRESTGSRLAPTVANPDAAARMSFPPTPGGRVVLQGVTKTFNGIQALNDVSLSFAPGSVTAILGQSGSGKSTLLRTINHLERLDAGLVTIDGHLIGYRREGDTLYELQESEILKRRADVGMVFQSFNLFPHLTVLENVIEAPIAVRGLDRAAAAAEGRDLLARVGLSEKADVLPRQLSGGQQQRVAIARALALRPKVLLFDEPTSALDPELVGEVLAVIRDLARSGVTLIIVTHEMAFARDVADRIVFMDAGRVAETATPETFFSNPTHPRAREFLSRLLT